MSTITAPLYFQFPPGQAEIYKQQSQIIGICPSGFTVRHVDVSSLQENAYEFVSNTDKNLKITILVHVEGIAGLRRITMKSSVSIQNKLPFPLEVIHPNVPRSDFISKTVYHNLGFMNQKTCPVDLAPFFNRFTKRISVTISKVEQVESFPKINFFGSKRTSGQN